MHLIKQLLILSFIFFITIASISSSDNRKLLRILQEVEHTVELETSSEENNESRLLQGTQVNNNTTMDVLIVPIYQSNLSQSERNEYLKWVDFENSLNSYGGQLAKLTPYFSPEEPTYFPNLYKYGWPFYALACITGLSLIVYIILRFGFKLCLGPKKHITSGYGLFTWILIILGFSLAAVFFAFTILRIINVHNSVALYTQRIQTQSNQMIQSIDNLTIIQAQLNKSSANFNVTGEFTTSIYNYDEIYAETESFGNRSINFAINTNSSENTRYYIEIACIAALPLFTLIALIGYCKGNSVVILIMSLFLLTLIIPTLIIVGLDTSLFIFSIDMCKTINTEIVTQTNPLPGKGIGFYVSCPSKPVQVMINTARFQLGNSFNSLFSDVSTYMANTYLDNLGSIKRNNQIFIDFIAQYPDAYLQQGLYSLVYLNQILLELEGLISCQLAQDIINYTEENFCYLNITYQFNNLVYFLVGILGLLILTIGVNKLIVLLNPVYVNLGLKKDGLEKLDETD